jgi:hypothetical protein
MEQIQTRFFHLLLHDVLVSISSPLKPVLEVKNFETKWSPFPIEEDRVNLGIPISNVPNSASNAFPSFALQSRKC